MVIRVGSPSPPADFLATDDHDVRAKKYSAVLATSSSFRTSAQGPVQDLLSYRFSLIISQFLRSRFRLFM